MTTEKETWLHEYARNKRLAEAEKAPKPGFSSKFTSDGDARMLTNLFGEGSEVIGHGVLVRRNGQTVALMKLLSSDGEPSTPAADAEQTTPAGPSGESGKTPDKEGATGGKTTNPLADPARKYGIGKGILDFLDPSRLSGKFVDSIQRQDGQGKAVIEDIEGTR